jgi:hypothetical protein
MTVERSIPQGGLYSSLLSLTDTLARNQKAPEFFKLTTLFRTVIEVETYRSQNGLRQRRNCQCHCHIWVYLRQPQPWLWCKGGHQQCECRESILTCCNCNLQDGKLRAQQLTDAAIMQNRNYSTEWACGRQQRGQQGGGLFFSKFTTHDLSLTAAVGRSNLQHRQQPSRKKAIVLRIPHEPGYQSNIKPDSEAKNVNT